MKELRGFCLSVFILLVSCLGFSASKPAYLLKINSKADFDLLKGEPLSKNFNGIECIKLVYAINSKTLYYLDSKRYKWHYPFVKEILGDQDELEDFNLKNYSNTSARKYILATFNYNTNTKNYFLQFAACDNPNDELIATLVEKVKTSFFKKDQFKLLLNSTVLLRRKKDLDKHGTITSDELYKNQSFQAICVGKTKGILRFVNADSIRQGKNYSNDVLVINGNSNEIPICKAVITNEFQTPLSHICLLTNNRKTPCAAQKDILTIDSVKALNNKWVEVIVEKGKLTLKRTLPEVNSHIKAKYKLLRLKTDTTVKELTDLEKLRYKNKIAFGSKVCNLAELKRVVYQKKYLSTPDKAFAIPFFYYMDHVRNCGADDMINALLKDSVLLSNDSLVELSLKKIRKKITKAQIDKDLLKKVTDMCLARFGTEKVRFRSSSNCEDEANFNGAGLYDSESGQIDNPKKTIENAIKKVWASLWTVRAFKERMFFNVDQSTVNMAVLVHRAIDDELANGVAITKNLYRSYDFGFVINLQKGEEAVVSPKKGMVCEQVVSYMNNTYADFYNKYRSADWITFSNLNPNASLLTGDELLQLSQQLESIKKYFYDLYKLSGKKEYRDFGMDVEFKLMEGPDKKRYFYFKQARPYNN